MDYKQDFVTETTIDLMVEGYPEGSFRYKPTTAGEENDWLDQYMRIENGVAKQDFALLNKLKLTNLVAVPWDKELLKEQAGIDVEWQDCSVDEKWRVLSKLRGRVFDKILKAINDYDRGDEDEKKP